MDLRVQFAGEWQKDEIPFAELCRRYGISRKTGYKWVERYYDAGPSALEPRSSRPHSNSRAIDEKIVAMLVHMRTLHPLWGPKKLLRRLVEKHPDVKFPVASTVGDILKRKGLVRARPRRRGFVVPATQPFLDCEAPNDVWCTDFKGHFRVGETRCYPLTLMDGHTRFLLRCQGLEDPDTERCWPIYESAFREFGLPKAIRSDNGPPFAARGAAGLSRLSVRWIRQGIRPDRIEPGHPEQNGRHERMHRTLREETVDPPEINMRRQQAAFDRFRESYNEERPHAALGQEPPARFYEPSPRKFDPDPPDPTYFDGWELRRVLRNGTIRWRGSAVFINSALADELVGLKEVGPDRWEVFFSFMTLGVIDNRLEPDRLINVRVKKKVSPRSSV
ncbi:MAG: integrase core domain-containing protein [Polyangiales bacterium]